MAISSEIKQAVIDGQGDWTYQELASKHGISRSSVSRIINSANNSTTAAGAEPNGDEPSFASDAAHRIDAEQEQGLEEIRIRTDEGLTNLLDRMADEDGGGEAAAAAGPEPPVPSDIADEALTDVAESFTKSLGLDFDEDGNAKARRRGKAPKRTSARVKRVSHAPSTALAAPMPAPVASAPLPKELPLPLMRTQLSLYLSSFRTELVSGGYQPSAEELDAQLARVPRMSKQELRDTIDSVRGTLTLDSSVATVTNGCLMLASVGANVGPFVGIQLQGYDRMLLEQKDELTLAAKMMVLDDWEEWQGRVNGKSKLAMCLLQSAMQCHNQNQIAAAHRRQEQASDELMQSLDGAGSPQY
jgi:hypothetical protein